MNKQEVRLHPRLEVRLPVRYRVASGREWRYGRLANLGAGGGLLEISRELPTETVLGPFCFSLSGSKWGSDDEIETRAVVLRVEESADEFFRHGLAFLTLQGEPYERVRRFVFENLEARGQ